MNHEMDRPRTLQRDLWQRILGCEKLRKGVIVRIPGNTVGMVSGWSTLRLYVTGLLGKGKGLG